jgi:hypothetical protein
MQFARKESRKNQEIKVLGGKSLMGSSPTLNWRVLIFTAVHWPIPLTTYRINSK